MGSCPPPAEENLNILVYRTTLTPDMNLLIFPKSHFPKIDPKSHKNASLTDKKKNCFVFHCFLPVASLLYVFFFFNTGEMSAILWNQR